MARVAGISWAIWQKASQRVVPQPAIAVGPPPRGPACTQWMEGSVPPAATLAW
ncbi:MAG: hypothetical protein IPG04_16390 [Polyangiaceae bacterium]|nr:hypothetical protein [Polyangiaceae bacterium]